MKKSMFDESFDKSLGKAVEASRLYVEAEKKFEELKNQQKQLEQKKTKLEAAVRTNPNNDSNEEIKKITEKLKTLKVEQFEKKYNTAKTNFDNSIKKAKESLEKTPKNESIDKQSLIKAAQIGDRDLFNSIKKRGMNPNEIDIDGNTALHVAVKYKNHMLIPDLNDVDVTIQNKIEQNAMHIALENKDLAAASTILNTITAGNDEEKNKIKTNLCCALDINDITPIQRAVEIGDVDFLKLFKAKQVDLKQAKTSYGMNILDYTIQVYSDKTEILEEFGYTATHAKFANPNTQASNVAENQEQLLIQDVNGRTPLHYAIRSGNNKAFEAGYEKINDKNAKKSLFEEAALSGNKSAISFIITRFDNEEKKEFLEHNNILHKVAEKGNAEMVLNLLHAMPEDHKREYIKSKNSEGKNIFEIAAEKGDNQLFDAAINMYKTLTNADLENEEDLKATLRQNIQANSNATSSQNANMNNIRAMAQANAPSQSQNHRSATNAPVNDENKIWKEEFKDEAKLIATIGNVNSGHFVQTRETEAPDKGKFTYEAKNMNDDEVYVLRVPSKPNNGSFDTIKYKNGQIIYADLAAHPSQLSSKMMHQIETFRQSSGASLNMDQPQREQNRGSSTQSVTTPTSSSLNPTTPTSTLTSSESPTTSTPTSGLETTSSHTSSVSPTTPTSSVSPTTTSSSLETTSPSSLETSSDGKLHTHLKKKNELLDEYEEEEEEEEEEKEKEEVIEHTTTSSAITSTLSEIPTKKAEGKEFTLGEGKYIHLQGEDSYFLYKNPKNRGEEKYVVFMTAAPDPNTEGSKGRWGVALEQDGGIRGNIIPILTDIPLTEENVGKMLLQRRPQVVLGKTTLKTNSSRDVPVKEDNSLLGQLKGAIKDRKDNEINIEEYEQKIRNNKNSNKKQRSITQKNLVGELETVREKLHLRGESEAVGIQTVPPREEVLVDKTANELVKNFKNYEELVEYCNENAVPEKGQMIKIGEHQFKILQNAEEFEFYDEGAVYTISIDGMKTVFMRDELAKVKNNTDMLLEFSPDNIKEENLGRIMKVGEDSYFFISKEEEDSIVIIMIDDPDEEATLSDNIFYTKQDLEDELRQNEKEIEDHKSILPANKTSDIVETKLDANQKTVSEIIAEYDGSHSKEKGSDEKLGDVFGEKYDASERGIEYQGKKFLLEKGGFYAGDVLNGVQVTEILEEKNEKEISPVGLKLLLHPDTKMNDVVKFTEQAKNPIPLEGDEILSECAGKTVKYKDKRFFVSPVEDGKVLIQQIGKGIPKQFKSDAFINTAAARFQASTMSENFIQTEQNSQQAHSTVGSGKKQNNTSISR